jgi:hypothetical protein
VVDAPLNKWTVVLDTNNNGAVDAGEQSLLTNADGAFKFDNLPDGTYHVLAVAGNSKYVPTKKNAFTLTLSPGKTVELPIGFARYITFSGTVFNDANADGERGSKEAGVAGITVFLDRDRDEKLDSGEVSTKTDSSGKYSITGLGTASVLQVATSGWWVSAQGSNLGITQMARIDVSPFLDANNNGKHDAGERYLYSLVPYCRLGVKKPGQAMYDAQSPVDGYFGPYDPGQYMVILFPPTSSGYGVNTPAYTVTLQPGEDRVLSFAFTDPYA